ncbi:MAG TPA: TetR/AcrR family transcriptional regulator [Candidatus Pygmaiobacter gallistercoris]|nr:TetR/AcrR family transcriptional regulator [Candidatus Pygmaiobacter gallistercoris]
MPKVGYSEEEREQIRQMLVTTALDLMAKQGIRHTTLEQVYSAVGISRSFFYSFFATKEDLIVETLYQQQPKILAYARRLMEDPSLDWREGVRSFLSACCYGERSGIAVMTVEDQQLLFSRLSQESRRTFRQRQRQLFGQLLECFGVRASNARIDLFTNISLTAMIVRHAIPDTLPFFVPQAAEETVRFQIEAILNTLEQMRKESLQS